MDKITKEAIAEVEGARLREKAYQECIMWLLKKIDNLESELAITKDISLRRLEALHGYYDSYLGTRDL